MGNFTVRGVEINGNEFETWDADGMTDDQGNIAPRQGRVFWTSLSEKGLGIAESGKVTANGGSFRALPWPGLTPTFSSLDVTFDVTNPTRPTMTVIVHKDGQPDQTLHFDASHGGGGRVNLPHTGPVTP